MAGHSPAPRRSRRPSKHSGDHVRNLSSDERTLPPPNTYGQYKRNRNLEKKTPGIKPQGESGRRGFHPWHFLRISFRSTSRASLLCNILWPVVPAAIAVRCKSW